MTYHKPELILMGRGMYVIQGGLGKPFLLYWDFRLLCPPAMTPGAYESDE
jgi:hypothetical protein